jgi:hypothetical protein
MGSTTLIVLGKISNSATKILPWDWGGEVGTVADNQSPPKS